jgi:hypothetical protein
MKGIEEESLKMERYFHGLEEFILLKCLYYPK